MSAALGDPAASELGAWTAARRMDIERLLAARVAEGTDGDPGRLIEAMRYSLLAPGKRLRPLLALAAAEAVGSAPGTTADDPALAACCATELVHCYSLIHDDLPAMDDDDFRRGRPSNHRMFDEATAILAGDALLTLAFAWIAEAGVGSGRTDAYLRAALALAQGAGVRGMVRGQARDLGEAPPTDLDGLERLHAEKTAALFQAAVLVGGAVGGASAPQMQALERFGMRFGVAFQHADDLDDMDHAAHAEAARARLVTLLTEAQEALAPLGDGGRHLGGFARALARP